MLGERARVDTLDPDDLVLDEIVLQRLLRTEVGGRAAEFAHDKAPHMGSSRFGVLLVDPVISNQRIGHGHNLTAIARIGENLLVPRHRGIKAGLTSRDTGVPKSFAAKYATVF